MLHVVRNPWSAYADTKKRPVPLSLAHYMLGWTLNQYHALLVKEQLPGPAPHRAHRGRDGRLRQARWARSASALGLEARRLARARPPGTARRSRRSIPGARSARATPEANRATAEELSPRERDEIRAAHLAVPRRLRLPQLHLDHDARPRHRSAPASSAPTSRAGCCATGTRCTCSCGTRTRPGGSRASATTSSCHQVDLS